MDFHETNFTPIFQDCSVVGLGDSQTDERVAAVVVINPNKKTNMEDLLKWCNENMEEAEVMVMMMLMVLAMLCKTEAYHKSTSYDQLTKINFPLHHKNFF